jgi:hypothetical protein
MKDIERCQVLKDNAADMSVVEKNNGREVHDVYGAPKAFA